MRRPVLAWLIYGLCVLAVAGGTVWLTLRTWEAEHARQQALLESELRNALWRMDSLAAPLLAIEATRPSFTDLHPDAPQLAPRLVLGYVTGNTQNGWTLRKPGTDHSSQVLAADSPFAQVDWSQKLALASVDWPAGRENSPVSAPAEPQFQDLIVWPAMPGNVFAQFTQSQIANSSQASQEVNIRNQLVQGVSQLAQRAQQQTTSHADSTATLTPARPMWIGTELILARRTGGPAASRQQIEFCWLNWPEWNSLLADQLQGLAGRVALVPVTGTSSGDRPENEVWQLVSLPVQLQLQKPSGLAGGMGPLAIVWGMLVLVAAAMGWVLQATLNLSERRAAFVSAVTHELRTPLTTFRLYSEMLSAGLATDPQQRQHYYETLHREANRLTHLVENVLAYARLEHGRRGLRVEQLTVGELCDRFLPRLEQRVAESPLTLVVDIPEAIQKTAIATNPLAVEQIVFNLVDNCCKYAADAEDARILCEVDRIGHQLRLRITDFGPGLSRAARKTLFRPFQKSAPQAAESAAGVGLGLALSQRLARDLGGSLNCQPVAPRGTCLELRLPLRQGV